METWVTSHRLSKPKRSASCTGCGIARGLRAQRRMQMRQRQTDGRRWSQSLPIRSIPSANAATMNGIGPMCSLLHGAAAVRSFGKGYTVGGPSVATAGWLHIGLYVGDRVGCAVPSYT